MKYRYWIENGALCVADESRLVWRGELASRPASRVVAIPGTDDAAVVLDPDAGPRNALGQVKAWPHLARVTPQGHVRWQVEAGPHDWWVSIRTEGDRLLANTWSGFLKELDPDTGRVLSSTFTK